MTKNSNSQKQEEPRTEYIGIRTTKADKQAIKNIAADMGLGITDAFLKTMKAVYPKYFKK